MSAGLMKVTDENLKAIKSYEGENQNELLLKQFYMQTPDGQIFIKKAGVLFKMNQIFGIGKYSAYIEFLTTDELKMIKEMAGIKEGTAFAAFKGVVKIGEQVYTDIGTASQIECRNGKYIEMASTRALLRAMKLATACGFTSAEEMDGNQVIQPAVNYEKTNNVNLGLKEVIAKSGLPQDKVLEIASKTVGKTLTTLKNLSLSEYANIMKAIQDYKDDMDNVIEGKTL